MRLGPRMALGLIWPWARCLVYGPASYGPGPHMALGLIWPWASHSPASYGPGPHMVLGLIWPGPHMAWADDGTLSTPQVSTLTQAGEQGTLKITKSKTKGAKGTT